MEGSGSILIAGAGIGGLATALSLARVGLKCHVVERAPEISEIGAGLQLGPNAFRTFEWLGLTRAMDEISFKPDAIRLLDSVDGRELSRQTLGRPFEAQFGQPYRVAYRADVQITLLEAVRLLPDLVSITLGDGVAKIQESEDHVSVTLDSGRQIAGEALIGADGLRSQVRAELLGPDAPRYAGHVAYRAVLPVGEVPIELLTEDVQVWIGPGHHLVCYKLRGGQLFNIVAIIHSERQTDGWDTIGDEIELERGFADACGKVKQLVGLVHRGRMWALCDRDPAPGWSRGRIALLGDAAHPMLPYVAQGACMAIEDGARIAIELSTAPNITTALVRYEAARYARAASVQLLARETGVVNHLSGVARDERNAALARRAPDDYAGIAWLFGGDGPNPARDTGAAISIFANRLNDTSA